ncbi:MAG: hypothetical protein HRU19_08385 [Pseudobacteriovorax sp.]|nr:hypothetical protein [Pseudobacteriovorax sp.]
MTDSLKYDLEAIANTAKAKAFLGKEFLTWFWYKAERLDGQTLTVAGKSSQRTFTFWVDDRLVLESHNSKVHQQTLKGGEPSQSLEAAASLQSGNSVKELRIGLNIDGLGDIYCSLSGQNLEPRTVKLPDPPEEFASFEDFNLLTYRLKATRAMIEVIDGLFGIFLLERTQDDWSNKGLSEIKTWIKGRFSDANQYLH